jgi:flagellar biosynthesis regulator FlaF
MTKLEGASLMKNHDLIIHCERVRSLMRRVICSNRSSKNNQITKLVEAFLYDYPMWKVNSEQIQSHEKENVVELRNAVGSYNSVEGLIVRRSDYILYINLIEDTMTILNPLQRSFVRQRYFRKTPFKIIAEELAVTERHLYRIRQDVTRIFVVSFGWL